ncbi:hypothetical protein E2562_022115 [Oryza meyeriana var. granulata]|uniref:Uncharacterized protein n=1 Tax=Oryza meyeriana var. granulata TaxID=110450 RepID=A0A6G1ENV0_9ORYZ|nr:hypothetical protein E2562_022115 [Oryza meyeriana var. granulata]
MTAGKQVIEFVHRRDFSHRRRHRFQLGSSCHHLEDVTEKQQCHLEDVDASGSTPTTGPSTTGHHEVPGKAAATQLVKDLTLDYAGRAHVMRAPWLLFLRLPVVALAGHLWPHGHGLTSATQPPSLQLTSMSSFTCLLVGLGEFLRILSAQVTITRVEAAGFEDDLANPSAAIFLASRCR